MNMNKSELAQVNYLCDLANAGQDYTFRSTAARILSKLISESCDTEVSDRFWAYVDAFCLADHHEFTH